MPRVQRFTVLHGYDDQVVVEGEPKPPIATLQCLEVEERDDALKWMHTASKGDWRAFLDRLVICEGES